MDKFSTPPICRQLDSFADNPEGMSRHDPVQARCRRTATRRLATSGRHNGLEHRSPHDDLLAHDKALHVPSAQGATLHAGGMATFR
ncbi:MAG: hypothetical protein MUE62_06220 [Burkholderiaceae bacterium]|jgi:hypothetical protein|nr:hypothetical protein [Burkholderiaceae bacterium]